MTSTTWAAAVSGDNCAAGLELSSGKAVIAIGGRDGSDDSPTPAQFKAYVQDGRITYYLTSGTQTGRGTSGGSAGRIASWVAAHFTKSTIGGTTVYDLTSTSSSHPPELSDSCGCAGYQRSRCRTSSSGWRFAGLNVSPV